MPNQSSTLPRRFRFGLRTMFVVVTVVSMWVAYSANWIRQREAMRSELQVPGKKGEYLKLLQEIYAPRRAPAGLWLFGEEGATWLKVEEVDVQRARRLFPEAEIHSGESQGCIRALSTQD